MAKQKTLTVGKVRFAHYKPATNGNGQADYCMTVCLVLWGGRVACEYINYGDGEPGHIHVNTRAIAVYIAFAKQFDSYADLERAIQAAIELSETERKLRERVRRDGKLVYRLYREGRYTYHVREMNAFSNYVPGWIRFFQPSVEFYERNERGAWVWVAKSFYETQQEAVK